MALATAHIDVSLNGRPFPGLSFNSTFNPINNPMISPTIGGGNMSPYMGHNWSSPNINAPMGGFGYGGPGMLSPYMYGGAYPMPYGGMGPYGDLWEHFDVDDLDDMLQMGYISAPQYNQYILMFGERPRRRGMWPFSRCRDRYRFMLGPGIGYGGLGRRGWMDALGLIPGGGLLGWRGGWSR